MPHEDLVSDDIRWWQRLRGGEQEALAYFYEKYADHLLRYGLSVSYNRELVRDAVQELFIQLWNRRQTLTPTPLAVKFYLLVSLRRLILKSTAHERQHTDLFSDAILPNTDAPSEEETEEALHRRLELAIRSLPPRQQEVLFWRFYEKLSYEQIATLTGLDYQVLRNTLYRAIKGLRLYLSRNSSLLILLALLSR